MHLRHYFFISACLALRVISPALALSEQVTDGGFAGVGDRHFPQLLRVNTLAEDGPGSLRNCVEESGPRVCVFDVSGQIHLSRNLRVSSGSITIAGETAPSPGIVLRGATLEVGASNVSISHLTILVGDDKNGPSPSSRDGLRVGSDKGAASHVLIDHVTVLWGIDENISIVNGSHHVLIRDSLIAEALDDSIHPKGPHSKGILVGRGSENISFQRNIIALHGERNPLIQDGSSVQFVNNLVYGWGNQPRSALMDLSDFNGNGLGVRVDFAGNVYLSAPWSTRYAAVFAKHPPQTTRIFVRDNLVPTRLTADSDDWDAVDLPRHTHQSPVPLFPDTLAVITPASDLETAVLRTAGSRPARRSINDSRIVHQIQSRSGSIKDCITGCSRAVGRWPRFAGHRRSKPALGAARNVSAVRLNEWLQARRRVVEYPSSLSPVVPR